jgi:hypothetical protein
MGQISAVTRETNATTQDTMTAVTYLAELAEQLRASVAAFRLPEQLAEAAGLPQGLEPPMSPANLPPQGQSSWVPGPDAFPALPAGPISASYAPQRNAFDIGAYDATWSEAPQADGMGYPPNGQALPGYDQNPYGQNPYGQNPYGQNPYGDQYPANPLGDFPFPPDQR